MKSGRFRFKWLFPIFFIGAVLVFGAIVMGLWNAILPAVIGVKTITFLQALGILVLSKILFGGFGRGGRWHRGRQEPWGNKWQEKWATMSAEEREKFKADWKNRCGSRRWGGMREENTPTTAAE
jgi:hypothetical protein